MAVGEKVLVLLPTDSNKLLVQWKWQYEIVEKLGKVDYKINMNGKVRTFHANMLKLYFDRDNCGVDAGILGIANVAMVDVQEDDEVDSCLLDLSFKTPKEKPSNVIVNDDLTVNECKQIKILIAEYSDV